MPEGLRPATWDDIIRAEAKGARVPPELALAIADTESGFDPAAISPKGARGIFQLMPETAKELGVDPDDPVQNIRGGLKYFRQQLDAHGGNVEKALQSYNWGPTNVAGGGTPPAETQQYVSKILSRLGGVTAANVTKPAPVTLKDMTQNIAKPPPGASGSRGGPIATPPPAEPGFLQSVAESMDPRTRTGRRNIAGGVGDIVGTAVGAAAGVAAAPATGGASLAVAPATGGVIGSAAGGMLAEGVERYLGTAPPDSSLVSAGAEQGAYAIGGRIVAWPIRAVGKRLMASRVGRFATESFDDLLTGARDALSTAREAARNAVQQATDVKDMAVSAAKTKASELVGGTRRAAAEATEAATGRAKAGTESISSRYAKIATAPPTVTPRVAGERAQQVIAGPARQAREEVGQMVEQAAESGPPVDIKALKAEAQRILGEEIRPPQAAFPKGAAEVDPAVQELADLAAKFPPEKMATMLPSQQVQAQAIHDALAKAQEDQAATLLKHPAMAVLGRILAADDTVPFKAAHLFKRELDDAIGTAWDKSVRNRVTNITKTIRGTLREALGVHEPYNQATAAYQSIAPLYNKGIAPKLRAAAIDSPESIIRLIKPNDPTKLSMLRDLLLAQPAKVGKEKEGQFAWDSVRSAWTDENLIKGPIEKIDDRIAKLAPEFLDIMYGDAPGQTVLTNLKAISAAFKQAEEMGAASVREVGEVARGSVAAAREMGQAAVSAAQATGKQNVRAEKQAGRQLIGQHIDALGDIRREAKRFVRSSLVRARDEDLISDALRAGGLGIGSIWGAQSIARLILRGPKSRDLIYFASHAPESTQLLVRALTGPESGLAMAELLRLTGLGEMIVEGVGTPPPPPRAQGAGPNARRDTSGMVGAPPPY